MAFIQTASGRVDYSRDDNTGALSNGQVYFKPTKDVEWIKLGCIKSISITHDMRGFSISLTTFKHDDAQQLIQLEQAPFYIRATAILPTFTDSAEGQCIVASKTTSLSVGELTSFTFDIESIGMD